MKQLQEACEGSEEASVTLHALTDDCMICLNKLFKADDGVWGAVKLQCTGCSKSPILHVSCMMKLQDKQQKCPQCRQPFSNARSALRPAPALTIDTAATSAGRAAAAAAATDGAAAAAAAASTHRPAAADAEFAEYIAQMLAEAPPAASTNSTPAAAFTDDAVTRGSAAARAANAARRAADASGSSRAAAGPAAAAAVDDVFLAYMTAGVAATRAAAAAGESHSNSAITYDLASSPPSSPRPRPPAYHDDPWPDMDLSTAYAGRTPPYSPPGSYALSPPRRADYASLAYTGSE
eukprot:11709-Heterococcus_DN1.PRE.1